MVRASFYIIACSTRNRIRRRLRRLREPRYLLGAIVGGAYMYFALFARAGARPASGRGRSPASALAAVQTVGASVAGIAALFAAAIAWLLPQSGRLLQFSEAEQQFLFAAPVTGRQLLVHRLARSQLPLMVAALVSALVFRGQIAERARFAASLFVLFVTVRVYLTGVMVARARAGTRLPLSETLSWAPMAWIWGAAVIVAVEIARAIAGAPPGAGAALARLREAVLSPPSSWLVWPFAALVKPLFAGSAFQFGTSMAGAVGVLALTVAWVLRSNDALEAVATETAIRPAETFRAQSPGVRAAGWQLPLSGSIEGLFLWKSALQMLRGTNLLMLARFGVPLVFVGVSVGAMSASMAHERRVAAAFCVLSLFAAGFAVLFGPQMMSFDLRSDLAHLEILKTWPVKGAQVVRGEILWPAFAITGVSWVALACAAIFSGAAFPRVPLAWRISGGVAAVVVAPAMVLAQFTIQNAAAVLFPAWVRPGDQRLRGLDAMGQRLILFGGVLVALVVLVGPGAIAGGIVWLALYRFTGAFALVPAAAVCLATAVAGVLLVISALGPAFDRVDLTAVERAE